MTPLYDRLETNIPRGLMGFSDLEWPEDSQLFPRHETVLGYIERYAEDVKQLIQFRRRVLDVSLARDERWLVKTQAVSREGSDIVEETFDAVIVANGHYNVPYIPEVPGIERWSAAYPGTISHSKFYRNPDQYAGKKVIVVGNSASGIDIGAQIQPVCKPPMLLSSKSESMMANAASPTQMEKPPIAEYIVEDRTVRFEDGTTESGIDAILYCTGYFYSLPFLESLHPPLITSGENVERLYQHIFYQQRPTLALMVLNQKVIPFPWAEAQAAVIARVFSGRLSLPDAAEMAAWERQWRKANGDGRMFHVLKYPKDADYINMLHDWTQEADGETSPGGRLAAKSNDVGEAVGKIPPYWGEREYWTRERSPAMKKAFQDLGEDRHAVRSLEQLGFDFEKWKAENERGV